MKLILLLTDRWSFLICKDVSVYKLRFVFIVIHEKFEKKVAVVSNFIDHNKNKTQFIN